MRTPGGFDLRAQSRNVDFNRVGRQLRVVVGELLGDLLLAQNTPGTRHEKFKQRPFTNRQLDRRSVDPDALGFDVDGQLAHGNRAGGERGPAQQGAYAGLEFGHRERLGEVIVGPQIEAVHAVLDGVACGQHQHIGGGVAAPKATQTSKPSMSGSPMSSTTNS